MAFVSSATGAGLIVLEVAVRCVSTVTTVAEGLTHLRALTGVSSRPSAENWLKMSAHKIAVFIVLYLVNNTQAMQITDGAPLSARPFLNSKTSNERIAQTGKRVRLLCDMLERQVKVLNRLGLHARPAAEFVRAVRTFQSSVTIVKNGDFYSGASILDVLSANLDHGAVMIFRIEGPDAETAMERLCWLLEDFKRQEEAEGI